MKILNTLTSLLSIFFYPLALTQTYPAHLDNNFKTVTVIILLVIIYVKIFMPLKANKFFNIIYLIASLFITYSVNVSTLPLYLVILGLSQLFICFFSNYDNKFLFNFAIPGFSMLLLIITLIHFLSPHLLINIILINLFVFLASIVDKWKQNLLTLMCVSVLTVILFLLHYISLNLGIIYVIFFIILIILKNKFKLKLDNYKLDIIRMTLSILLLII